MWKNCVFHFGIYCPRCHKTAGKVHEDTCMNGHIKLSPFKIKQKQNKEKSHYQLRTVRYKLSLTYCNPYLEVVCKWLYNTTLGIYALCPLPYGPHETFQSGLTVQSCRQQFLSSSNILIKQIQTEFRTCRIPTLSPKIRVPLCILAQFKQSKLRWVYPPLMGTPTGDIVRLPPRTWPQCSWICKQGHNPPERALTVWRSSLCC